MFKLTIEFETKQELIDFLGQEPIEARPAKKPKAAKKPKEVSNDAPTATQVELRAALKKFALETDPEMARTFMESQGVSKLSDFEDSPEVYGKALAALADFGKEKSNG